ncbi:AAA domain-containing protein [Mycolicibacterium parafortuitum]
MLQWHLTEVEQLDKVLALGNQLDVERQWFQHNNLPVPDWNNLHDIRRYADLVEAATAADEAAAATSPIDVLHARLSQLSTLANPPSVTGELAAAVGARSVDGYGRAYERLQHLHRVAQSVAERDRIRRGLDSSAPRLATAIAADPAADCWDTWLGSYEQAWQWEMTGRWILAQDSDDVNSLKVALSTIEDRLRTTVERLAAERAWGHAVAPDRITGSARANLTQYAQLVSRLGKGTGKYAAKQRVAIAEAMDRCRPSVPVWIMPLYRIAEQIRVQPNLYDVVIVDEASQAGLEASFLQYLAPKMVVIGDDKQVSPSAVGVDQQKLRDLATMYLFDDPYRESWLDPKCSYFDAANMRFGGRITLTEHRRCVPEIIGFSNRIAYEPEGIRLIPVRQFGADRLDPIKVVYLENGYESPNKTNLVEAEAIVSQIQQCLEDPRYAGATFGVISLLGNQQAKLIEAKLMDAVTPEQWSERELRCGDASDFQGSERDIMFLSMVKGVEEGKRMAALTMPQYVQRYNVAASRAKDQMWVYHSMPREALTNHEDMRFQLLDYCYGVAQRVHNQIDGTVMSAVPEDAPVEPFDSLFEQRVFNRIIDRGYSVLPQVDALGYRIDMVVTGAKGRLAIECDGDFWHGPDAYEADLARQRELERCGWKFFRIRESVFYADMPGTLRRLWDTLDELGIHTADWVDPSATVESEGATLAQVAAVTDVDREDLGATSTEEADEFDRDGQDFDVVDEGEGEEPAEFVELAEPEPGRLAPYAAFDEQLPPIQGASLDTLVANVVRIVKVEGPVMGHRVHDAYRNAYGGQRVGRELARTLNRAIELAVRRGLIVAENPLRVPGVKPRTFRLPTQPEVLPRELGPRTLSLVPPAELAEHLAEFADLAGQSETELFKAVLDLVGLKRLTENAGTVLADALTLVPSRDAAAL